MRRITLLPSQEELRAEFRYDPWTGTLFRRRTGLPTGSVTTTGHLNVGFKRKKFLVHRIIWKMIFGGDPPMVDHRNNIPHDNRLQNLRAASDVQNKGNCKPRCNNQIGIKGVRPSLTAGKFCASMSQYGKKIHLGTFDSVQEAHEAYCKAAQVYFGEFWRAA